MWVKFVDENIIEIQNTPLATTWSGPFFLKCLYPRGLPYKQKPCPSTIPPSHTMFRPNSKQEALISLFYG